MQIMRFATRTPSAYILMTLDIHLRGFFRCLNSFRSFKVMLQLAHYPHLEEKESTQSFSDFARNRFGLILS